MAEAVTTGSDSPTPVDVLLAGGTYQDVVGFTDAEMEAFYYVAYNQYESGDYENAEETFRVLCLYDHSSERFWMGLGATRQKLKDYLGAVMAYSMVVENGHANPYAALHAAECHLALGLLEEAIAALDTALDWCTHHGDPDAVIAHVEVLYGAIDQAVDSLDDQPASA